MRIAFVWTGVTSYMADCWRRLASEQDVELKVWIDASSAIAKSVAFDTEKLMAGVECEVFNAEEQGSRDGGEEAIVTWRPDFLFVVGWRSALCRAVVEDERLKDVPKVCCFDMPWRWQFRCLVAPLVLWRFLRKYQAAFVPGAVCERYAKWLGFKKVYKGLFAIDTERFFNAEKRRNGEYFLYIGRNSAEKRLDDLRRAHAIYRERGGKLELRMYGKGLEGGFVKPEDVPALMRNAAAFVLASDFDPWPLVLLEAMAAGCPVIASDRCTNRPELGKNWRVFKCGEIEALSQEFFNAEKKCAEESEAFEGEVAKQRRSRAQAPARNGEIGECMDVARMAEENLELARQYDCGEWVKRVERIVAESAFNAEE